MPESKDQLEATELGVRALLLAQDTQLMDDVPEEIQLLYRRLVRTSLFSTVQNAIPITIKLLGSDQTNALIARFLDEEPPSTRFLRDVPMQFRDWLLAAEEPPAHPALPELVHWEVTELEVLYAPDVPSDRIALPQRPAPAATVEFHPSARLFAFVHPVHTLNKQSTAWPAQLDEPAFVLAHRVGEHMRWVSLPAAVAKVLALAAEGAVVAAVFETLRAEHGALFDEHFARSWLVNLQLRGAITGFPEE